MLIFDQIRKNDAQLRALTLVVLCGLGILLAGLWWVQVVSFRDFQNDLETQSFRTVRIPAVRGKILDRDGQVLAENRPTYNVSLYLEELRRPFSQAYTAEVAQVRADLRQQMAAEEKRLGHPLSKQQRRSFTLSPSQKTALQQRARYEVATDVVAQISRRLQQPLVLNPTNFERHYETRLVLPYPLLLNLDLTNVARFEEQSTTPLGVDLEVQSTRLYPHQTAAGHLLGSLKRDNSSAEGEEAFFSYRLPDFRGAVGIEYGFDKELRGMAGAKSVQVNNIGYRTTESVWSPAESGKNVVLTLDLFLQQAAERELQAVYGPETRGAVVVMDVESGDVLALASSPTINPNYAIQGYPPGEMQRRHDEKLRPEFNRATQGNYFPGSIFKTVVGLAALEAGLNPAEKITVAANPNQPTKGYILVRGHPVRDTAPPGDYDFTRALYYSCNSYFISNALRLGPERIVQMAQRFHLGEKSGLPTLQDAPGFLPSLKRVSSGWTDGNTANLSIGQDPVQVTPLQVAVIMSAVANGGRVIWPRIVDRIEPQDPSSGEPTITFSPGAIRDRLGVSRRTLEILQDAMLADTEAPDGTGKPAAREAPGLRICGKTGTAQIQDVHNDKTGQTTWFASFAPYKQPRWAVVVMIEDGASGGGTCSPVAGKIYRALLERDRNRAGRIDAVAKAQ